MISEKSKIPRERLWVPAGVPIPASEDLPFETLLELPRVVFDPKSIECEPVPGNEA